MPYSKTFDFPQSKTSPHSPAERLPAGEVGDVDEGVVEGGVDVRDAKDLDSLSDLRAQLDLDLLGLLLLSLAGGHLGVGGAGIRTSCGKREGGGEMILNKLEGQLRPSELSTSNLI